MIAKLIAYGDNRNDALQTAKRALDEFLIEPINTTIDFHKQVLNNQLFIEGKFSTHFVAEMLGEEEK